jgi:hypothetical protein
MIKSCAEDKRIKPLPDDDSLNPKYPGGTESHAKLLKEEGHKITPGKGKKPPKVTEFERVLM